MSIGTSSPLITVPQPFKLPEALKSAPEAPWPSWPEVKQEYASEDKEGADTASDISDELFV